MAAGNPPPPKPVNGERKRNERIGDQLRKYYDDVAKEPIPEEFLNTEAMGGVPFPEHSIDPADRVVPDKDFLSEATRVFDEIPRTYPFNTPFV